MVTFLNDKTDKHLRASFFDNFVNVVAFVDQQCSPILCPLLQQVNLLQCVIVVIVGIILLNL